MFALLRYFAITPKNTTKPLGHPMSQIPQDDVLALLYDVARLMRLRGDQHAKTIGMTRAQWVIMMWLDRRPGISQNELALLIAVEPITVARLIDRLEIRGIVERRPDESDRRVWRLHLTEAAQPVLTVIKQYRDQLEPAITRGLSEADLINVSRALRQMKTNLLTERPKQRGG